MLVHNDNAPAHTSHVAMVAMHKYDFELLSQSPYFADVTPSDFQLSSYLKELFRGCAFEDNEDVVMAINEKIEQQGQNFFCEGVKVMQQRWEKGADHRRNCV